MWSEKVACTVSAAKVALNLSIFFVCSDACAIHAKFASVRMRIYGMLGNFVAEGKPEVQTTMDRMSDPQWDDLSFFCHSGRQYR